MIRSGDFNKRVAIKRNTITKSKGEVTKSPTTLDTVWAKVTELVGREAYYAKQIHGQTDVEVKLYYFDGLTKEDWFEVDGETLNIVSLICDDRSTEHIALCRRAD